MAQLVVVSDVVDPGQARILSGLWRWTTMRLMKMGLELRLHEPLRLAKLHKFKYAMV